MSEIGAAASQARVLPRESSEARSGFALADWPGPFRSSSRDIRGHRSRSFRRGPAGIVVLTWFAQGPDLSGDLTGDGVDTGRAESLPVTSRSSMSLRTASTISRFRSSRPGRWTSFVWIAQTCPRGGRICGIEQQGDEEHELEEHRDRQDVSHFFSMRELPCPGSEPEAEARPLVVLVGGLEAEAILDARCQMPAAGCCQMMARRSRIAEGDLRPCHLRAARSGRPSADSARLGRPSIRVLLARVLRLGRGGGGGDLADRAGVGLGLELGDGLRPAAWRPRSPSIRSR